MDREIICSLIDLIGKVQLAQVTLKSKSAFHKINNLPAILIIIIITKGNQMDSINGVISSTKITTTLLTAVLIKVPCRNVKAVMNL